MRIQPIARAAWVLGATLTVTAAALVAQQAQAPLPSSGLQYAAFRIRFAPDGALTLQGPGWPTFSGTWKNEGGELTLVTTGGPPACSAPSPAPAAATASTLSVISRNC